MATRNYCGVENTGPVLGGGSGSTGACGNTFGETVDAPGGSLREGLLPLPYKEPSGTLFQLLGFCVEAGTRFAAIADQKVGEGAAAGAPVGTTMALMERGARVMSAIHKRLHYAQKIEFKLNQIKIFSFNKFVTKYH